MYIKNEIEILKYLELSNRKRFFQSFVQFYEFSNEIEEDIKNRYGNGRPTSPTSQNLTENINKYPKE